MALLWLGLKGIKEFPGEPDYLKTTGNRPLHFNRSDAGIWQRESNICSVNLLHYEAEIYKSNKKWTAQQWRPSERLKTQREGCQFVMNLSTSFGELKLLLLFPFCFVLPRSASGLFWFDSNGNGCLCLTPTLLCYLFLYFISTPPIGVSFPAETFHFPLSLQTPFWSPSVTTEPPLRGNNNDLESKCQGTRSL